jgi:2'-5' RNA ligase
MARMRTFIAVELDSVLRDRCVALQEKLARSDVDVKWVERENLHVTLLFLGEILDREIPGMCKAVAEVGRKHAAFPLSLQGVGCFPNARRPRVVWVGLGRGQRELIALHDALEPPLLELGCYRREEREYTPHVTLGRVKGDEAAALAEAIGRCGNWQGGEMEATELRILASELTRDGPQYTVLSTVKLREADHFADEDEEEEDEGELD